MRQCFKRIMALGLVLLLIFSVGMQSQTYAEEETPTSQSSGNAADQSLPYNGSKDEPAPEASPSGQPQDPAPEASPSGQPQDPAPEASPSGQPQDPAPEASPSGQSQEPDPDASQSGQSQEPEYEERLLSLEPGQEELIDFGPDAVITLEEISSQFIDFSAQEGKLSICALKAGQDSFKADVVSPTLELHIEYIVTVSQQAENSDDTQQEETEMVTATFVYGEEKTETVQYDKGSPLGALPQPQAPEGYSFLGWEYTDSQGVPQYAGEDTLISEDTLYTARFSETAVPALVPNSLGSSRNTASATGTITFYIAIDDAWVSLGSREMTAEYVTGVFNGGTENRYCLTAEQLESVYGPYGFEAEGMTENSRLFPHTTPGDRNIYGNRMVRAHNGVLYSPLRTDGVDCDVYYLPNAGSDTYQGHRDDYISNNSFYTVEVIDPGNKVYGQDESLPPTAYVLTGKDYTVRVKAAEGVDWQYVGEDGTTTVSGTETDGIVSFTIDNIRQPYTVSPVLGQGETLITYDINLRHEPSDRNTGVQL